jgi:hypothetical protein
MEFDYKQYPRDYFQVVWCSPPCTNYSRLKTCWYNRKLKDGTIYTKEENMKDMNEADKIVLKSFEIIDYFNPHYWFVENPATGRLKDRDIMKDKKIFYDVDYCMYSDWGYKKTTRIWTNRTDFEPLICDGSGSCGNMIVEDNCKLHKVNLGGGNKERMKHVKNVSDFGGGTSRDMRYRIPPQLIYSLIFD